MADARFRFLNIPIPGSSKALSCINVADQSCYVSISPAILKGPLKKFDFSLKTFYLAALSMLVDQVIFHLEYVISLS